MLVEQLKMSLLEVVEVPVGMMLCWRLEGPWTMITKQYYRSNQRAY